MLTRGPYGEGANCEQERTCPDRFFKVAVAACMVAGRALSIGECHRAYETLYPATTGHKSYMKSGFRYSVLEVWAAAKQKGMRGSRLHNQTLMQFWRQEGNKKTFQVLETWKVSLTTRSICSATNPYGSADP